MQSLFFALALAAIPSAAPQSSPDDAGRWEQWRGPEGTGISAETAWVSEGKAESLWEAEVGLGYSSVVVSKDRLYTLGHDIEGGMDVVFCLSASTGEELWSYPFVAGAWAQDHHGGTVNTPTLDQERLYVLNREGNLHCLKAKSGDELWSKQLKQEHGLVYPNRGFCGSPLVLGDQLIVNLGKVFSLDKRTGEVRWMSAYYGDGYATPMPFELEGRKLLVIFNGDSLALIDQGSGAEVHKFTYAETFRNLNAATPVLIGEAVFVSSKRINGGMLLAFGAGEPEVLWSTRRMTTYMAGCVLMKEQLFGFDDDTLRCLGTDGKERWGERGMGEGALLGAGERLIVVNADGELVIAEANPVEYVELWRTKIFDADAGYKFTTPVLVDGLIYCRSSKGTLLCLDHRSRD